MVSGADRYETMPGGIDLSSVMEDIQPGQPSQDGDLAEAKHRSPRGAREKAAEGGAGSPAAPRRSRSMARAATTDTVTLRRTFVPVAVLQIEGEGQQAPIVVEGEGAVLGRAPVHGVTLPDPAVSRAHAKLELREGEFWIRDLGSSNGTIVNGMLVAECQLKPGDRILLGDTTLVYDKQQRLAGYRVG